MAISAVLAAVLPLLVQGGFDVYAAGLEGELADELAAEKKKQDAMSAAERRRYERESKRRFELQFGMQSEKLFDALQTSALSRDILKGQDARSAETHDESLKVSKQARRIRDVGSAQDMRARNREYLNSLNRARTRRRMRGVRLGSQTKAAPKPPTTAYEQPEVA